jgi:hypothetical protein
MSPPAAGGYGKMNGLVEATQGKPATGMAASRRPAIKTKVGCQTVETRQQGLPAPVRAA